MLDVHWDKLVYRRSDSYVTDYTGCRGTIPTSPSHQDMLVEFTPRAAVGSNDYWPSAAPLR